MSISILKTYMVVYVSEDFLGSNDEMCHFPNCLATSEQDFPGKMRCWWRTVSKSMDVNLKSLLKNGGTRMLPPLLCEDAMIVSLKDEKLFGGLTARLDGVAGSVTRAFPGENRGCLQCGQGPELSPNARCRDIQARKRSRNAQTGPSM